MSGTSWLLGGGYPWYSVDSSAEAPGSGSPVIASPSGLSLPSLRDGPLGLFAPDGSIGRLVLPLGVAVDGGQVFVLATDGSRVYRWDPVSFRLVTLPEIGACGVDPDAPTDVFAEARRFRNAPNIAAACGLLYVADLQSHRVQVFDLTTLALVRVLTGVGRPIDVAASRGATYILDGDRGRVYRASHHRDAATLVVDPQDPSGPYTRVVVDRSDRVYLLTGAGDAGILDEFDITSAMAKRPSARITDPAAIRDRFDSPLIRSTRGGLELPPRLADPCELHTRSQFVRRYYAAGLIYAIDTRTREVRVLLPDGRERHRFGAFDRSGQPVVSDDENAWRPAEVADGGGCALILDERWQAVYVHRPSSETIRLRFTSSGRASTGWRRIAVDESGCILLWNGIDAVDRVDASGRPKGKPSATEVAHFFKRTDAEPAPQADFRLTRQGQVLSGSALQPSFELAYQKAGTWTSTWLDSGIYNCQWHLLEIAMADLPAGSRVVVRTRTSNEPESDAAARAAIERTQTAGSWRETEAIVAPAQAGEQDPPMQADVLVQNGAGQYLQLQIVLSGTGFTTPSVFSLRLRFPRESFLQHLPAIYSQPDAQRALLDRLLSIVQSTWFGIEAEIESFERFLDPDSVPEKAIPYLAGWLDVTLEETWTADESRMLLRAMPELCARWGTVEGLRRLLRIHLARLARRTPKELEAASIPQIVERFVERRRLTLGDADSTTLPSAYGLWSPAFERRFQVGVFDVEGEIELVSSGDPDLDVFRRYAHAFRVFVPAAWIRTPEDEAMLRRAIESQKPAHTTYELVLVEPDLRVGEQSTIGLDTVIGGPGPALLACGDGGSVLERVLS
jgi:phage tail-like protein